MVMWSSDWRENPRNSGFFVKKCKRKRDNSRFFRTFANRNHNDKISGRLYDLMVRAMPLAKILKVSCSRRRPCFIYRNTNRESSRINIHTIRAGCTASCGGHSHFISLEKRVIQLTTVEAISFWAVNHLNLKGSYSTQRAALFQKCAVNDLNLKGSYSQEHL